MGKDRGRRPIPDPTANRPTINQYSQTKKYPTFKTDTDIITRTSPIQETVQQNPGGESKIKGIPSVSAQAGSSLNTVSMTQTTKNNTSDESKIKGIPSVSAQADSNLNTLSMTHTLKLKKIKEVPLQHR